MPPNPRQTLQTLLTKSITLATTYQRICNGCRTLLNNVQVLSTQLDDVAIFLPSQTDNGTLKQPNPERDRLKILNKFPDLVEKVVAKLNGRITETFQELHRVTLNRTFGTSLPADSSDQKENDDEQFSDITSVNATSTSKGTARTTQPVQQPDSLPFISKQACMILTQLERTLQQPNSLADPNPLNVFGIRSSQMADWIGELCENVKRGAGEKMKLVDRLKLKMEDQGEGRNVDEVEKKDEERKVNSWLTLEEVIDRWNEGDEELEEVLEDVRERMAMSKASEQAKKG